MRLAIITTHPIQYNAPWFKLLGEQSGVELMVFYTWSQTESGVKFDPGFGKSFTWDIPLLEGYDYRFVTNTAKRPGSSHFSGIVNPTLIREVEQWKPDLLLVIGWAFNSHLKAMIRFKGKIPVLFRGDSTLLVTRGFLKDKLRHIFLWLVYHFIDKALYVGANNKQYYRKHGLKESQLFFSPHAIENTRFNVSWAPGEISAKRKDIGCSDADFVVLFAGKLEKIKNPFFLLEVAKRLQDDDLKIVFAGNGKLEADLKQRAKDDDRIVFLDFHNQTEMPLLYAGCDLFVLPSFSETWGLALNEAMASGKAVAASDQVGAAIDLIGPDNGLIFGLDEYDLLVDYIRALKADRSRCRLAGEKSRQIISRFSFENLVKGVLDASN